MITTIHPDLFKRFQDFETLSDITISTTDKLVKKLYTTAKSDNLWWYPPRLRYVPSFISLTWYHRGKILNIYVLNKDIRYTASWGDVLVEHENGDISIENDLTKFWEWIAE